MLPISKRTSLPLGLLASAATVCAAVTVSSAQPGPTASASAPSASASAAAPAKPPLLRGADIPAEASDAPKIKEFNDEWSTIGKTVSATREASHPCTFTLVREWLRIRCEGRIGATMFAGDPADVKILAAGGPLGDERNQRVTIILRMKRGETKLFSLVGFESGGGYDSFDMMNEQEKISVSWREGREDPLILVSRF